MGYNYVHIGQMLIKPVPIDSPGWCLSIACRLVPVWLKSDRYEHSYRSFKLTILTTNIWTLNHRAPQKQQSLYTTFPISHLYCQLIRPKCIDDVEKVSTSNHLPFDNRFHQIPARPINNPNPCSVTSNSYKIVTFFWSKNWTHIFIGSTPCY